jgi:hypothetical protein
MRPAAICLAALLTAAGIATASARDVYCYTTVMPSGDKLTRALSSSTLYITPVFQSDEDVYLLEATFQETVPTGGLASCVSDEDEGDIRGAWQEFIDSAKAEGSKVEMKPAPPEYGQ